MNPVFRQCVALLLCALAALSEPVRAAPGEQFSTRIIAVLDGDTVLIRSGNGTRKIRLAEIDAPEKAQPFGADSRQSLADMVLNRQVQIVTQAVDAYGRLVATLSVDGLDVNAEQIRRGMAWEYSHYHGNRALVALEAEARQAPRGLWAMNQPTPPWEWRKQHPDGYGQHPAAAPQTHTPSDGVPRSNMAPGNSADPACHPLKRCSAMRSCDEARRYMQRCGSGYMDGDGDGVPCEKLCGARN